MKTSRLLLFFDPQPGEVVEHLRPRARQYLQWIRVCNYRPSSVTHHAHHLRVFILWCEERGVSDPGEVTLSLLERYQRHLHHHLTKEGKRLSVSSQVGRLSTLRMFYKWMVKKRLLPHNPASELEMPKIPKRLPRIIINSRKVEEILRLPDVKTVLGLRNRAILETLYSTGVRAGELTNLKIQDLDLSQGMVMIRQGKGDKDRLLPIGDRALQWIESYLEKVRPEFVREPDQGVLFLTHRGTHFNRSALSTLVRGFVRQAGVEEGSCHLFRHTMATLMLENGADIRYVQQMLGHVKLETTQVYTHLSIQKLKEVHTQTHPAKAR